MAGPRPAEPKGCLQDGTKYINEHSLDHSDDEGQGIQVHLHQDSSNKEHQQDDHQASQDPSRLGDPLMQEGIEEGIQQDGSIAHKVMTLLKMTLRQFCCKEGANGVAEH